MDNKKLTRLLEGIVLSVLGILIAIFGTQALNNYFGILLIVLGSVLALASLALLVTKKAMLLPLIGGAGVALAVGIGLLSEYPLSIEFFISFAVIASLGFGCGLFLFGIFRLVNHDTFFGPIQTILGALLITLTLLYMYVPDFRKAFWIIAGILIAVYGVLLIVFTFVDASKLLKKKKK